MIAVDAGKIGNRVHNFQLLARRKNDVIISLSPGRIRKRELQKAMSSITRLGKVKTAAIFLK